MNQTPNDSDGRPAFYRYCRRPGTRCNDIMQLIDMGFTDEEIAELVSQIPSKVRGLNPNAGCSAETISVYRKAHDNRLCDLTERAANQANDERDSLIWAMHDSGARPTKIAEALGVSIDIVRYALKRLYDRTRR